jgi:UDP-N-acetylmuramoylalanine--D-glutamate ligase
LRDKKFYFTLRTPQKNEFGLMMTGRDVYLAYENNPLLLVNELPVKGKHYQANALAALAIGHGMGLPFTPMLNVLREFKGLPHRCQFVRERNGVTWYNDSKGTNVGATQAAIEGLGSEITGKLILIAGGLGKNADFHSLVPVIEKYVRHVVLIGKAAKEIADVIADRVPVSFAASMEEAVKQSDANALSGDSVLLSPACASWDMFNNFEHRGNVFMESVGAL